ncbi:MAG: phage integrase SAM-like domain-containing protein [Cyclobacteriaceae bacterium]|nr:phage integrase SAM-like domain-containing protein [Cyclobacteriaceae bacterium]
MIGKAIQIANELHTFSFDAFTRKFDSDFVISFTIYDLFSEYIEELKQNGQVKTSLIYQTAANSINSFQKSVHLVEISPEWLEGVFIVSVQKGSKLNKYFYLFQVFEINL